MLTLAGYRRVAAFAQFGALLRQPQRQEVECFYSPGKDCYPTPSITTFHNILATLPPDTLEGALREFTWQQDEQSEQDQRTTDSGQAAGNCGIGSGEPRGLVGLSIDGKDVHGASTQAKNGRRMLLATVEQGRGMAVGQLEIESKSNEIPALQELADCATCPATPPA